MSKYKAKRTEVDGIKFASQKEARRYLQLKALEKDGCISDLRMQVPYILIPKSKYGRAVKYIADFVYTIAGETIIEDVKGVLTPVYKLKKRMMAEKGLEVKEWR